MVFDSLFRGVATCIKKPKQLRVFGSPALGRSSSSHLQLCTSSSSSSSSSSMEAVESSTSTAKKEKYKGNKQQRLHSVDQHCSGYLVRILNSEIKFARDSDFLHCAADIPEDFPFTVQDNARWRTVVLERKFQGETITVLVDIPPSPAPAEHSEDEETDAEPSVPLAVIVSKENGLFLQFDGRVFPGRISVHGLSIKKFGDSKDGLQYAGPDFSKLKENFLKAIHDYLETRGLTSSTANFLLQYMMGKDAREYLRWLRNLKLLIGQK